MFLIHSLGPLRLHRASARQQSGEYGRDAPPRVPDGGPLPLHAPRQRGRAEGAFQVES